MPRWSLHQDISLKVSRSTSRVSINKTIKGTNQTWRCLWTEFAQASSSLIAKITRKSVKFIFVNLKCTFCVWKLLQNLFPISIVRQINAGRVTILISRSKELHQDAIWILAICNFLPILPVAINCLRRVANFVSQLLKKHVFSIFLLDINLQWA